MGTPVRDLVVSEHIDAPAARVWAVVSDIRRTPEWSTECRRIIPLGARAVGTRFVGLNRRGLVWWPTVSTVTALEEGRRIAWQVTESGAEWSYEITPDGDGCTLTERRVARDGMPAFATAFTRALLGGTDQHSDELEEHMRASLRTIRRLAQR